MKKSGIELISGILIGMLGIVGIALVSAITAFIGKYLWNNIVAQIFDVRTLTAWQVFAVCVVVDFFMYKTPPVETRKTIEVIVYGITANLMFLLLGWIAIHFI